MANTFQFTGGTVSPSAKVSIKFLAFLLFDKKEIPYWTSTKTGLLDRPAIGGKGGDEFETDVSIIKLFISEYCFGKMGMSSSFYLNLAPMEQTMQMVTIKPYNAEYAPSFRFIGSAKFMKNSEVLPHLDPNGLSAKLLGRSTLPVDVYKKMCSIDVPKIVAQNKAIRKIRVSPQARETV